MYFYKSETFIETLVNSDNHVFIQGSHCLRKFDLLKPMEKYITIKLKLVKLTMQYIRVECTYFHDNSMSYSYFIAICNSSFKRNMSFLTQLIQCKSECMRI